MPEAAQPVEEVVINQTTLFGMWFLSNMVALGRPLIIFAGLVAFFLTLNIVRRRSTPQVGTALMFIVPIPVLVSMLGVLVGMNSYLNVVGSGEVGLKAGDLMRWISTMVVLPIFGLLSMVPSYVLALIFLCRLSIHPESASDISPKP